MPAPTLKLQLDELRTERAALLSQAKLLASQESMTESEEAEVTAATELIEDIDSRVNDLEAQRQRSLNASARLDQLTPPDEDLPEGQLHRPATATAIASHVNGSARWSLSKSYQRQFRSKNFRSIQSADDEYTPEEKAFRFGQWCLAKMSTQIPQLDPNEAALQFYREEIRPQLGALTTGNAGSSIVPDEFVNDLVILREQYGVARQLCRVRQMASDVTIVPREVSQTTAAYYNEDTNISESDADLDDIRLVAQNLSAISRFSANLADDSPIDVGDYLAKQIAWRFAYEEDQACILGDGTSTYGGQTGLKTQLESIGIASPGLTNGAGDTWAAITLANFEEMMGNLPMFADNPNTVLCCHKSFYHQVLLGLMNASGGTTLTELADGQRVPSFQGYPVVFSAAWPNTETNEKVQFSFGDHSLAATFGERKGMEISFSTEANVGSVSLWTRNQIGVRGTERFNVVVHDFGTTSAAGPVVSILT